MMGAGVVVAVILLVPPLSTVGRVVWTRRLSRRGGPRFAVCVAYVLAALGGLVLLTGLGSSIIAATGVVGRESVDPSQKARILAAGISEVMNCGALVLVISTLTAGWIAFWKWRGQRAGRAG